MRRLFRGGIIAAIATVLALPFAQPAAAAPAAPQAAYFKVRSFQDTFVIKLTDPAKIKEARDIVNGTETDRLHVLGRIKKESVSWNQPWDYYLDPDTVSFFEVAIEVCDASPSYVQDHLDEAGGAFLPGYYWCPWSSRVVSEVPAPTS